MKTLEKEIEVVVNDLLENGVSAEEVKRAQDRAIIASVYEQDSQQALANLYGSFLVTGATIEEIQTMNDRLKRVTPDDVMKVARKYLKKSAAVTGYLRPEVKQDAAPSQDAQQ